MRADQPACPSRAATLTEQFKGGLTAPICLTWELTYACNLQCVHCLSASGRRDPRELSTAECMRVVDELERMQVFYANIGGGEPTLRPDFWDLLDYSVAHHVGIKFSTNGVRLDKRAAQRLARTDYVDVQISIDGATADVNDAVRGTGSFALARRAMDNLAAAGFGEFKISIVVTRQNVSQLDTFKQIADAYGARLRVTRLRPVRPGRRQLGRPAPDRGSAAPAVRLAVRAAGRAHRRLLLSPVRARRPAAGTQPVRRGPRGLPDRPGRRRLRLPVRAARGIPGGQRPRARRLHPAVARVRAAAPAARAGRCGRLRVVRDVRRLPGRVHGREVLYRAAAGRAGPGVRAGTRRARTGDKEKSWSCSMASESIASRTAQCTTLRRWQKEGLYRHVKGVMPSVTNANNTSICCGAFPQVHGITGNSYLDTVTGPRRVHGGCESCSSPNAV